MSTPAGWTEATLADVASWSSGGTPRATNSAFYGGSIPWAVIGDLNDGLVSDTAASITEEGLSGSSAKVVEAGTLLVAMYGSIGKLGVAGKRMATNQAIACAVPSGMVETRYLFWYLRSVRGRLQHSGKGATQSNISQTILKAWPISFPNFHEQKRIVEAIEEQFSRLDAAEESLMAARRRAKQLWVAALSRLASGPLMPLSDLLGADMINGRSVPTREAGFPVLRLNALGHGLADLTKQKGGDWDRAQAEKYLVRAGDFLIARGNGSIALVGRGGLVVEDAEVAFPDTMIRVRADAGRLSPKYLCLVWDSYGVREQIERTARTTAGIYKINQQDLRSILVPCPSMAEQDRAVTEGEHVASSLSHVEFEVGLAGSRARGLRRAVLREAFAGRLIPSGVSAADERVTA